MFVNIKWTVYRSNDDQLMLEDQFVIKNTYESSRYCVFIPDPIKIS